MLAFASLVLLDTRLHIIRNKRTAHWKGLPIRISKFFVLVNKYIWGKIKRFRDPKIVEKEVVVEKEVEKYRREGLKLEISSNQFVRWLHFYNKKETTYRFLADGIPPKSKLKFKLGLGLFLIDIEINFLFKAILNKLSGPL